MCKCNDRRKVDQVRRSDQLRVLAWLLKLEEHQVHEKDMEKWRIAKVNGRRALCDISQET